MPGEDKHALLAVRNAVENASTEPISNEEILAILRGEGGRGSHLRAVFGDVSLRGLARAGAAYGIPAATILAAYAAARTSAAAVNPELDRALKDGW